MNSGSWVVVAKKPLSLFCEQAPHSGLCHPARLDRLRHYSWQRRQDTKGIQRVVLPIAGNHRESRLGTLNTNLGTLWRSVLV